MFQVNQVVLDAPTDNIRTLDDARLFVKNVTIRDWSGNASVSVVEKAVPALFSCADEREVMTKHAAGELKSNSQRVNIRGVKRVSNGEIRILIREIRTSDPTQAPTGVATQLPAFLGLCEGGTVASFLRRSAPSSSVPLKASRSAQRMEIPSACIASLSSWRARKIRS